MAHLEIGKRIADLRRQKKITQEQLASMVGVSAGAVSKWETGSSVPDIALLSPLARALNTTLDTLLSFQRELSKEEVSQLKQELTKVFLQEGYAAGKERVLDSLREYPNSTPLKLEATGLLFMYSNLEAQQGEAFLRAEKEAVLAMYQEILASGDARSRAAALFCAASLLLDLGRYGECEQALQELFQSSIDPTPLYSKLLQQQGKDEEAETLCQQMLLQHLSQSAGMLSILMRLSEKTGREEAAERYLDALNDIQARFGIGLGAGCLLSCHRRLAQGKRVEAAQWFLSYIKAIVQTGYDYQESPYFGRVRLAVDPQGQKRVRQKMLSCIWEEELPTLRELSGIPAYEEGVALMKSALSS